MYMNAKLPNKPILLIDSANIFIRNFCANSFLNLKGVPAGGIIGFLNSIKRLISLTKPKRIICIWEGEKGSIRKRKIFPEYKKNRKPSRLNRFYEDDIPINNEENRKWQNLQLINFLKNLPVQQICIDGTEADDIIGYLVKYKFKNEDKIILSSDKDFYQLLDEKTKIYCPAKKNFVDKEKVIEKFDIHPNNFCLARTFIGDVSDNINGIRGCGEKTMAKTFSFLKEEERKTTHDIFDVCEENKNSKKKIYKKILENKDIIARNWKLMHLDTNQLNQQQIKKLNYIIDNFEPKSNKLGFMKVLFDADMQKYSPDLLFSSIAYISSCL